MKKNYGSFPIAVQSRRRRVSDYVVPCLFGGALGLIFVAAVWAFGAP